MFRVGLVMTGELLIKLAGELSKLKYSDKSMNSLSLKHNTHVEGQFIVLHSYGVFHGIPIEITTKFKRVDQKSVETAFEIIYNLLKSINPSREFMRIINTHKEGINHKIAISIIVGKSRVVEYMIKLSTGSTAHCKYDFEKNVIEYGFENVNSLKTALFLVSLLQAPILIINKKDKMIIKQLLMSVSYYALRNGLNSKISVSIDKIFGDVVIKLHSSSNHMTKVAKFNINMIQGTNFEDNVRLIHSVMNKH